MNPSAAPPTPAGPAATPEEPQVFRRIARLLDDAGIRYCHWKSNYHIQYALAGDEDFDLLVARHDFRAFARLMYEQGFRPASTPSSRGQPGVFHFLGVDTDGRLLNVHSYTRILTGDHLLKSYGLPFEGMLLENRRLEQGVYVPTKTAEMIVFTFRLALKVVRPIDRKLVRRGRELIAEEFAWLMAGLDRTQLAELMTRHFPGIEPQLVLDIVDALAAGINPLDLGAMARRLARPLARFYRYGALGRAWRSVVGLAQIAWNRLAKERHMELDEGGVVLAVVGPHASGKSTVCGHLRQWLGRELGVRYVHVGKPPSTFLTWLPNRLIPLMRRVRPEAVTHRGDQQAQEDPSAQLGWLYVVRKLMLAIERRKVLRDVFRRSRNGRIVLCDRYPADDAGTVDSASFTDEVIAAQRSKWKQQAMRWETAIYRDLPAPDIVVELTVSLDDAIQRNLGRDKPGQDTEYLRRRSKLAHEYRFRRAQVVRVPGGMTEAETLAFVRREVWSRL
jgi:thymidylate kinase